MLLLVFVEATAILHQVAVTRVLTENVFLLFPPSGHSHASRMAHRMGQRVWLADRNCFGCARLPLIVTKRVRTSVGSDGIVNTQLLPRHVTHVDIRQARSNIKYPLVRAVTTLVAGQPSF